MLATARPSCCLCDVKVGGENGETPGYARPPSAVLPLGPTDKRVLELGNDHRHARGTSASITSARVTRSSHLYEMSRPRSTACLVM